MVALLANLHAGELDILFVLLAFLAFAGAVWCAIQSNVLGAVLAAFVGIVILVLAV